MGVLKIENVSIRRPPYLLDEVLGRSFRITRDIDKPIDGLALSNGVYNTKIYRERNRGERGGREREREKGREGKRERVKNEPM